MVSRCVKCPGDSCPSERAAWSFRQQRSLVTLVEVPREVCQKVQSESGQQVFSTAASDRHPRFFADSLQKV